jgi:tripeptide aminopeptidase
MTLNELYFQLVKIDSPTGEEQAIAQFVQQFLNQECGLDATIDNHHNVFVRVAGEGEPLFFNAHLDTVEPGRGVEPVIVNDVIQSAGDTILGADNKASLAAILYSVQQLRDNDASHRPLELLFTVSEESKNVGAIEFDHSKITAELGFIFDLNQPVGTIVTAAPFYARFSLDLQGVSAHASRREEATPVIADMVSVITDIENLRSQELLVNIGQINGGHARNTVLGQVQLEGELRSYDKDIFQHSIERIEHILDQQNNTSDVTIAYEVVVENPGYVHSHQVVTSVKTHLESILGHDVDTMKTMGCSDGNIFNDLPNLTTFDIGDGGKDAHTTNESISVQNLEALQQLTLGLMTNQNEIVENQLTSRGASHA